MPDSDDAQPSDRLGAPATDSGEGTESGARPETCRVCGSAIDLAAWHPVAAGVDENDEFHLYVFCSAACRSEWTDD